MEKSSLKMAKFVGTSVLQDLIARNQHPDPVPALFKRDGDVFCRYDSVTFKAGPKGIEAILSYGGKELAVVQDMYYPEFSRGDTATISVLYGYVKVD
jgi:hypothetical protein